MAHHCCKLSHPQRTALLRYVRDPPSYIALNRTKECCLFYLTRIDAGEGRFTIGITMGSIPGEKK